jgi:hypothetical protein
VTSSAPIQSFCDGGDSEHGISPPGGIPRQPPHGAPTSKDAYVTEPHTPSTQRQQHTATKLRTNPLHCSTTVSAPPTLRPRNLCATWTKTSRRCAPCLLHRVATTAKQAILYTTHNKVVITVCHVLLRRRVRVERVYEAFGAATLFAESLLTSLHRRISIRTSSARPRLVPSADIWSRLPLKATRPTRNCSLVRGRMYDATWREAET